MNKVLNTVRAIIGLSLLVLVLIFCFQNMDAVNIQFLTFNMEGLPLFIALIGVLSFGAFIGFLFGLISGSKRRGKEQREERAKQAEEKRKDRTRSVEEANSDATNSVTP